MSNVWIEKRRKKNGYSHRVKWRIKVGKRPDGSPIYRTESKTYATASDANTFEANKIAELAENPLGLSIDTKITVADYVQWYLDNESKTKGKNTYKQFDRPALTQFAGLYGQMRMVEIRSNHLIEFRTWLSSDVPHGNHADTGQSKVKRKTPAPRGYAPNTVAMRLRPVWTAFKHAMDAGTIKPFKMPKKWIPGYEHTARYNEKDDLVKFFKALRRRHYLTYRGCMIALAVGLRRNEMIGLDWRHGRRVWLEELKQSVWEFTLKRPGRYRATTKYYIRTVLVPPEVAWALGAPRKAGQVFRGLTESVVSHQVPRAVKDAKMARVTPHGLRHNWATDIMTETGDKSGVQMAGGWRSEQSMAIYQHITKARQVNIVKANRARLAPFLLPNTQSAKDVQKTKTADPFQNQRF